MPSLLLFALETHMSSSGTFVKSRSADVREGRETKQHVEALRRENEHLRLLQQVAAIANAARNVEEALRRSLAEIGSRTGWPYGCAYLVEEQGRTLKLTSPTCWYADDPDTVTALKPIMGLGRSTPGRRMAERGLAMGTPVWRSDLTSDVPGGTLEVQSGLAVPVTTERVDAVLVLLTPEAVLPDRTLMRVLGDLGAQLGYVFERRRADQALRDREHQLNRAQELAGLGSWEWNAKTGVLQWSDQLYRIYGLQPGAEMSYERFLSRIHPDDRENVQAAVERAMQTGAPFEYRERIVRPDGTERILNSTGEVVVDDEGTVRLVGVCHDVTEAVRAEQAAEKYRVTLEQRNRELQDFAYVASHDLQEPLRKIRAFSDLLLEDYEEALDENGRHFLLRVQDAATRMSTLISDLLAFSRVTTKGRPFARVNLGDLVKHVLSDLEVLINETGGVVHVESLPTIEADPTQMRQLLQNLIGNALKFHRKDVAPVVRVRATRRWSDELSNDGRQEVCALVVADNGIGFDEKYLDRIFTPFQRLHSRDEFAGTGMGLAICRRIVERHHGTLRAESTPGRGSTFTAVLPLRQIQDIEEDS